MKESPYISPEQRAQIAEIAKKDGVELLKAMGAAGLQHLQEHPESTIAQMVQEIEESTGMMTVLTRGLASLLKKKQAAPAPASGASCAVEVRPVEERKR